jgi:acetyltransferase
VQIQLADPQRDDLADELAPLLVDSVAGGASVGFLHPLTTVEAARFWREALSSDATLPWVARDDDGSVVGVVQLRPVPYPNGAHRADVAKLLVHSAARGHGIARRLMAALEA